MFILYRTLMIFNRDGTKDEIYLDHQLQNGEPNQFLINQLIYNYEWLVDPQPYQDLIPLREITQIYLTTRTFIEIGRYS